MSAGARGGFSVTDFKVPRRYLDMIIRPDSEGGREYVDQPGLADDDYISSLEFMDRCLRHFRKTGYESLANASMVVPFGSFGMIVSSVADSKDFEEAPKRCVAAVEILRPDLVARFVRTKDRLKLDITCKRPATTGMEIGLEFFVLALHTSFRWMTGKSLRPVSVRGAAKINGFDESLLVVLAAPMTRRGTGVTLYYPLDYAGIEILPVKYESWGAQEVPEFLRMMQEAAEARSATDGATAAPVAEQAAELIRQGVVTEAGVAQRMEAPRSANYCPTRGARRCSGCWRPTRASRRSPRKSAIPTSAACGAPASNGLASRSRNIAKKYVNRKFSAIVLQYFSQNKPGRKNDLGAK